jgi:hypothetical protein
VRADLGQLALREVRIPLVQLSGYGQLEHAVADELESLVRRGAVRRPGGVREDVLQALARKLVDQTFESCVTGAR